MEQPIRIIIADDHGIVRHGLRKILSFSPAISIIAEASNGSETVQAVMELGCDVLLLDVSMPDMSGIEVLRMLKSADCLPNTLMLSMHRQPQFMEEAARAGAMGYLTKDVDSDYLLYAVRRVAKGERVGMPGGASLLSGQHAPLSARERQILSLLTSGKGVSQIAQLLFVSPKTVSTHKTRIMQKLGVKTDAELFRLTATL